MRALVKVAIQNGIVSFIDTMLLEKDGAIPLINLQDLNTGRSSR
ncbi:MAG: hypothetical protein WBN40_03900 [Pseudomonadales bacterium]